MMLSAAVDQANELTRLVRQFIGAQSASDVDCPRARTEMTPCIGRDGSTALADDDRCVGCNEAPSVLIAAFTATHPEVR